MLIIREVNLGVAFEANRDSVIDLVSPLFGPWINMVEFDFDTAVAMANTTPTMTGDEQLGGFFAVEWHRNSLQV